MEDEHWEDAIWRGRFRDYSPLELVKWAERDVTSRTAKLAMEELERQLIAMGCVAAG